MDWTSTREGHVPYSGRYRFTATFAPGQIVVWINGQNVYGTTNPTDSPKDMTMEYPMSRLDAYKFEAIPGPLHSSKVDFVGE